MNITFFGSSHFSIPVLEALLASEHSVVQVISTPDKKQGRGQKVGSSVVKAFAENHRLPVLSPEKLPPAEVVEHVKTGKPDFMVIASYGKLIPPSIFSIAKIAPLNVHPSLLPKYRGASPIQQAILDGNEKTGVSIAEIIKELDAGDIFAQEETEIDENENGYQLEERLAHIGAKLVLQVITQFEAGPIRRIPQDSSTSSYAKKITSEAGLILWNRSAQEIYNQVRAYVPWPSAFTFFRGKRLKVLKTQKIKESSRENPGSIQIDQAKRFLVQTGTSLIELIQVQLEGRKEMSAYDFAVGQRIEKGERFESS